MLLHEKGCGHQVHLQGTKSLDHAFVAVALQNRGDQGGWNGFVSGAGRLTQRILEFCKTCLTYRDNITVMMVRCNTKELGHPSSENGKTWSPCMLAPLPTDTPNALDKEVAVGG
eukprot:4926810-Amphidinium_carterae.1